MSETYNIQAIVLYRQNFREKDVLVNLYSKECGRLNLVARGAQKFNSKSASHIEPANLINVMVVRGKQFDYLGTAQALETFPSLKDDYELSFLTQKTLSWLEGVLLYEDADENLFNIIFDFLFTINSKKISDSSLAFYFFIFRVVSELGFTPDLNRCSACQCSVDNKKRWYFDFLNQDLKCEKCVSIVKEGMIIFNPVISKALENFNYDFSGKIFLQKNNRQNFIKFVKNYLKSLPIKTKILTQDL